MASHSTGDVLAIIANEIRHLPVFFRCFIWALPLFCPISCVYIAKRFDVFSSIIEDYVLRLLFRINTYYAIMALAKPGQRIITDSKEKRHVYHDRIQIHLSHGDRDKERYESEWVSCSETKQAARMRGVQKSSELDLFTPQRMCSHAMQFHNDIRI